MATIDSIDLGINTHWTNEFAGSAIDSQKKYTEDGGLYVFTRKKQKFRTILYECSWQTYADIKKMAVIRDAGIPVILLHNDGREFNVMIDAIDSAALRSTNKYAETAKFKVTLNLSEV